MITKCTATIMFEPEELAQVMINEAIKLGIAQNGEYEYCTLSIDDTSGEVSLSYDRFTPFDKWAVSDG